MSVELFLHEHGKQACNNTSYLLYQIHFGITLSNYNFDEWDEQLSP